MHPDTGRHDTGWGHPEHQGRLPAIVRAIEHDTPVLLPALTQQEGTHAALDAILRVHSAAHVERVRHHVDQAAQAAGLVTVAGDTVISAASWDAGLAAAGCALDAAGLVLAGRANTAFALCRPPGHHATAERVMGFCLFNNVAVTARALQAEQVERVLIVDWDVHHGNGTQDIFWEDPSVYYLSLHQYPWYPGSGADAERGAGRGRGTTRNVPVRASTPREHYLASFHNALDTACEEFRPEFVLVSAGYDCMAGDPLGRLLLEPRDLYVMTRSVVERALAFSHGHCTVLLEGGYAPDRVGKGVVATLHALCGLPWPD